MPWGIRKKGSKYQLVNKQTGKVKSNHTSREKAAAARRAIGANTHKKRGSR